MALIQEIQNNIFKIKNNSQNNAHFFETLVSIACRNLFLTLLI